MAYVASPIRFFVISLGISLVLSNSLQANLVAGDESDLKRINLEIAAAEDRGDQEWLASVLAPELAFRRASGVVVGREKFLSDVKARGPSKTEIESIKILGKDRAIVTAIVTLKMDGQDTAFHNVRLFIRQETGWKVLGWANERMAKK
jgi:hypothetical protein